MVLIAAVATLSKRSWILMFLGALKQTVHCKRTVQTERPTLGLNDESMSHVETNQLEGNASASPQSHQVLQNALSKYEAWRLGPREMNFVHECIQKIYGFESCGNTVSCFVSLILTEEDAQKRHDAIKAEKPFMEVHGFPLAGYNLWKSLRKGPESLSTHQYAKLKEMNVHEFGRFQAEILRDDEDKALPRMFIPYLAWRCADRGGIIPGCMNKGDKGEQTHTLLIVKTSNDEFHIAQGYITVVGHGVGYSLKDWLASSNKFANPEGFDRNTMAEFLSVMGCFAKAQTGRGVKTDRFDSSGWMKMFNKAESGFSNLNVLRLFAWKEALNAQAAVGGVQNMDGWVAPPQERTKEAKSKPQKKTKYSPPKRPRPTPRPAKEAPWEGGRGVKDLLKRFENHQ